MVKPRIVAKKMPITATRMVLVRPTRKACQYSDVRSNGNSVKLMLKPAVFHRKSKPEVLFCALRLIAVLLTIQTRNATTRTATTIW